jgi:hypothetical protein
VYNRTERSWRGLKALQEHLGRGGLGGNDDAPEDVYGPTSFSDNIFDRAHDLIRLYFNVSRNGDLLAERFLEANDAPPFAAPERQARMDELEGDLRTLVSMLRNFAREFDEMSREIDGVRSRILTSVGGSREPRRDQ